MTETTMIAVVPVRRGVLPFGADETIAEAGGEVLLVGSGCAEASPDIQGLTTTTWLVELGEFSPSRWADVLASAIVGLDEGSSHKHVLLPGSPDGRDLGPRLAAALGRDYVAGAIRVTAETADRTRYGGRVTDGLMLQAPIVATLQPGVRGIGPADQIDPAGVERTAPIEIPVEPITDENGNEAADPTLLAELPADPSTIDLAEAKRIVGGGAGLGSADAFERLGDLAAALGASPGGTRVITDWGWLPVERQIGTTGVTVDPALYIAIGVSGAVQHTAGLGAPDHVISVNTDPHCPMMGLADLAIVCDGPSFLDELLALLDSPAAESAEDT